MSKTEELVVIDQANMKHLSLPTQKLVNELSKELDIKKLTVFNPLVESMIEIEKFEALKYDKEDDVTVLNFKEAKSTIRSFRASTKKTKSALKKPIIATGKKLDTIEKTFIERATKVLEKLEAEFKPYLDEEEKKKEERLAKKNKATTDKIAELSDEAVQQKKIIERGKLFSKLQTEISGYVPDAVSKVKTFSKGALSQEIEGLKELNETGYNLEEDEKSLLLEEQQEEITTMFKSNIESAIHILQTELDKPEPSVVPGPSNNSIGNVPLPQAPVMEMVAPSLTQSNPDYFKNATVAILNYSIDELNKLDPANDKEKSVKTTLIESYKKSITKVNGYL